MLTVRGILVSTMWYLYIIQCADSSLYTGITTDVAARAQVHNSGNGSKYVRSRGGGEVVYTEQCSSRSQALKREAAVKRMSREQKHTLIAQKPNG